ncbi:MAG: outer membrane protein assembly factor BamA [Gammaproteobacteria bacterium]
MPGGTVRAPGRFALALCLVLAVTGSLPARAQTGAQSEVRVQDIRVEGLQRISAGTVFNYLPVRVGDTIDPETTGEAIRGLYQTGFFRDVRIELEGSTLVVVVSERPAIASIDFEGNSDISTEDLIENLKQVNFAVGRSFDRSVFDQVEQELRRSYFAAGKYAVRIESTVTPLERNRVGVRFDISEGRVARIRQINIVGNMVFDDDELLDLMSQTTPGFFTWITRNDQYSKPKLAADLEVLRSYYLDRGYINFNIDSTQVSITPDRRDVYITINITEGQEFFVSEVRLAGDLIVEERQLVDLVKLRPGDVFSRKAITDTSKSIGERLGEEGYAFANVNAVPEIDPDSQAVAVTFFVDPGKRVYVRRVEFTGNAKTQDEVLRREMRQFEGGWISTAAVERSRERLQLLGYFEQVNVETPAVPGTTDQVDVDFSVVESPAGNLSIGAGFSQSQGFVISATVVQDNFLGTGNRVGVAFNTSEVNRNIGFSWFDPYFTDDGVSRNLDIHFRKTDARDANLADYDLDELGGNISFGIPISEFNEVNVGAGIERTKFSVGSEASQEVRDFAARNGDDFLNYSLDASWSNDTRNSKLLPTRGSFTRLRGEVTIPGSDLTFFKVSARHQRLFPLSENFTLSLDAEIGYGDGYSDTDDLPLINNFFGGGIRSVRGFEANTLGPRDTNDDPLGGDKKLVGRAELIMPVPFFEDTRSIRLTTFVDTGAVYGPGESLDLGELRVAAGISGFWLSPLGPLTLSLAVPIKDEPQDDTQPFQFAIGTTF